METLNSHTKLHIEAERQAHKLSNEMWLQQSELNQTQERALQDSLSALVKQNRQLLGENENLMRKNEKLILKCELVGLKQYSGLFIWYPYLLSIYDCKQLFRRY